MPTCHYIHPARIVTAVFMLSAVIGWSIFISRIAPDDLVQKLGVTNGYLAALLLSFSGGILFFTAFFLSPYRDSEP